MFTLSAHLVTIGYNTGNLEFTRRLHTHKKHLYVLT